MDFSTEQPGEVWVNQVFGIPSVPEDHRTHYPFSKGSAFCYHLKMSLVVVLAVISFCYPEQLCHRLSLLLNGWLLFVICETVLKNYPWREPLNIWMWKLYLAVPCSQLLLPFCAMLLILVLLFLGTGCELTHPLEAGIVGWLCCMSIWPRVKESWHREERSDSDYDQFSSIRPSLLIIPSGKAFFAALRSPSLLAVLAAALVVAFFVPQWMAGLLTASVGSLVLSILCCHRLPSDAFQTMKTWKTEEDAYARTIENKLRMVKGSLEIAGLPDEGSDRFHQLAVHVPLLLREAEILQKAGEITERQAEELKQLTTAGEVVQFCQKLDKYGPYTTACCVS